MLSAQIVATVEPGRHYKVMEVCGGHTHTIYKYGVDDLLPVQRRAGARPGVSGLRHPDGQGGRRHRRGAPARGDLHLLRRHDARARLARHACWRRRPKAPTCAWCTPRSTRSASRSQNPDRDVVFFAIGFETTAPSTALTLMRASAEGVTNFFCFCNHVTIVPPLRALLESPDLRLDGFIGPGHVSTVVGARPFEFIPKDYGKPVVISGFEPLDVLQGVYMVLRQLAEGRCEVENQYTRVVPYEGNPRALEACAEVFELRPHFEWRGLGFISQSGLRLVTGV